MRTLSLLKPLAFLLAMAAVSADAQSIDEGVLNAVSYGPLPGSSAIFVEPLDNSDLNLEVQAEFERQLRAGGYTISADAVLILTFETRDEIGAWSDRGRRTVIELQGRGGVVGRDSASARVNLFDSAKGGVLNRGQGGGTTIVTPSRYRLDVTIDDRRTGVRLWKAWAIAELQQYDGATLTKAMVPTLVRNLGESVKSEPFELF